LYTLAFQRLAEIEIPLFPVRLKKLDPKATLDLFLFELRVRNVVPCKQSNCLVLLHSSKAQLIYLLLFVIFAILKFHVSTCASAPITPYPCTLRALPCFQVGSKVKATPLKFAEFCLRPMIGLYASSLFSLL